MITEIIIGIVVLLVVVFLLLLVAADMMRPQGGTRFSKPVRWLLMPFALIVMFILLPCYNIYSKLRGASRGNRKYNSNRRRVKTVEKTDKDFV